MPGYPWIEKPEALTGNENAKDEIEELLQTLQHDDGLGRGEILSLRRLLVPEASTGNVNSKDQIEELLQTLQQETGLDGAKFCLYNGFWCRVRLLPDIIRSQRNFIAHNDDIILATLPKSGTTWLKALAFTIANRNVYSFDQSPLLTTPPHDLVPFLESNIYTENENPNISNIPHPRFFSTHVPYDSLSDSIRESDCRVIYICRNPLDHFISHWHFLRENKFKAEEEPLSLDEAFNMFCSGIHPFGPFWDHVLVYWHAHLENPRKVLFLKYEDLKEDTVLHIKKIAEFIELPFSHEEEEQGVAHKIASLCSFEHLKNLEVNKVGKLQNVMKNKTFFRKGEVGDWVNYLDPTKAKEFEKLLQAKLGGSGLKFKYSSKDKAADENLEMP